MNFLKPLTLVALLGAATTGFAQETNSEGESESPNPLELNMGEPDIAVGDVYIEGEYTDWEIRCIKSEDGNDPCQLYQLLADPNGNSVSLETEMMHGVDAKRQHDRAMAIYQSSMTILRSTFSRR